MVWTFYYEMTLSDIYRYAQGISFTVLLLLIVMMILVFFRFNTRIFETLAKWNSYKNRKKVILFLALLSVMCLILMAYFMYLSYSIDQATTVRVDEKIIIIELDDYWSFSDDASYFYEPYGYSFERYRNVSDVIINNGFVGTVGVTPYIFEETTQKNFSLYQDAEMLSYLKELEDAGFEIGMHGYNHCRNSFYCSKYEEVWYNVHNGKNGIERLLRTKLYSYFPPGNEWTTEQYENVRKAGFVIIGNTHVERAYFDGDVIITPKGYDPIYVYDWYNKDFRHTSVDEWIDAYDNTSLFILQLHANTFDSKEKLDDLETFLKYVKEDGGKSMTYKDFYSYIMDKEGGRSKISGKVFLETD